MANIWYTQYRKDFNKPIKIFPSLASSVSGIDQGYRCCDDKDVAHRRPCFLQRRKRIVRMGNPTQDCSAKRYRSAFCGCYERNMYMLHIYHTIPLRGLNYMCLFRLNIVNCAIKRRYRHILRPGLWCEIGNLCANIF